MLNQIQSIIDQIPNTLSLSFDLDLPDPQEQMLKTYVVQIKSIRNIAKLNAHTHIQAATKTVKSSRDRVIFRLAKHPHLRIVYGSFGNKTGIYASIDYRHWSHRHVFWRLLRIAHEYSKNPKTSKIKYIQTHESVVRREVFVQMHRKDANKLIYLWLTRGYNVDPADLDQLLITFQSDRKWWQALW